MWILGRITPCWRGKTPQIAREPDKAGDLLVDCESEVFEDMKAEPGQKALVPFHTIGFEGSIGLVNILNAIRLQKKRVETSTPLYDPGVRLGVRRGFPKLGDEAFPGRLTFNRNSERFMSGGGRVHACRFALQAPCGHGEGALIPGITPIAPQDVLDCILPHKRADAVILDTWTVWPPRRGRLSPGVNLREDRVNAAERVV